jgi:hypothetical protein
VIRFEYELNDSRAPLYEIILEIFPTIFQLSETLLKEIDKEQAVLMLHLICKLFFVGNKHDLCPFFMIGNNLNRWLGLFLQIMEIPSPPEF